MANFESGLTEGLVTAGRPCTGRAQWAACRAGYEAAVTQTRALFFPSDVVAPEPPRRRLDEAQAAAAAARAEAEKRPLATAAPEAAAAVRDVVVVTFEGDQIPLVVRDGSSLVEAAHAWCRAERPYDELACARTLNILAVAQATR